VKGSLDSGHVLLCRIVILYNCLLHMQPKRNRLITGLILIGFFCGMFTPFFPRFAIAASLTTVRVALTNENTSATDNIAVTFTPATPITNASVIEVTYDDDFTGGAALTNADVAVTGTNITSSVESNFSAGYFKSTLTTSAAVTGLVTITIDGTNELTNPATAGNYPWGVAVDIGGVGSTYDYGAGLAYVSNDNDVTVTATVPPTIDMEIYQQNSGTMTNACALGILSLAVVKSCIYDIAGATNNASGMTVKITSDGTLNDGGGHDINAVADGSVTAGSEEYGLQITDDGDSDQWDGGTYETGDRSVPTSETTFASTSAPIDGINNIPRRFEVTHKASMATDTWVADYDQLVTYTAFTN